MPRIEALPHQWKFLLSTAPETALIAGIRSGKTWAGALRVLRMLSMYPAAPGMICANTWAQLVDSTLAELTKFLDSNGRRYELHEQRKVLTIEGRRIFLRSLENYDAIRGLELGWAWIDEASYSDYDAYRVVLGRLSHPDGPRATFTTMTPRGKNWVWRHFYESPSPDRLVIDGISSHDNTKLPADYLAMVERSFSGEYLRQEVYGQFVSMRGMVYVLPDDSIIPYKFDKTKAYDVSIDFGRRRPAVLFIQQRSPGVDVIFDALLPEDVLIQDLCKVIASRYPHPPAVITCDPAGDASNTQTYQTDVAIVKQAFPHSLLRYVTSPRLRAIEAGIGMTKARLDRGQILVSDTLRRRGRGEYVSVVEAFAEYAYPDERDGKEIRNKPAKDGKSDHPMDALRYYVVNKYPVGQIGVSVIN